MGSEKSSIPPASPPGLPRALGPWIAVAIVVGTVIGSGVFLKPTSIAQSVPNFTYVALVWTVGGVLTLLGALAIAEVAVLFPEAGGNYVYLREGYGRLTGFLWGWVEFWVVRSASIAALATAFVGGLTGVAQQVLSDGTSEVTFVPWMVPVLTIAVIVLLALVNMRGVRWGGGLMFFITLVKIGSLLAIMILPFACGGLRSPDGIRASLWVQPVPEKDFLWGGLSTAFLGVLWAYHGWLDLAPIAGEVKRPQRNLPIAFFVGMLIIIVLYVGANVAYHLVLPQTEIASLKDTEVVPKFASLLVGPVGSLLASAAIMISVFGALNGNLLVGPRLLYAMGQDGLAPRQLCDVHARYCTPVPAIAVLAGWSIILVLAASGLQVVLELKESLFDLLTNYAMFGALIFETLGVTTIFVFRRRYASVPRAYRCPGYPWTPLASLLVPAFVLVNMLTYQPVPAIAGLGFIGLGAFVFLIVTLASPRGRRERT